MRALIVILALSFAVSACGKKAPLRAPEKQPEQQSLTR
ncbi:LPS translocon maturation chaperone LptM [Hyphococcus sp.]|jgi:predicted small lipoprotein YifL